MTGVVEVIRCKALGKEEIMVLHVGIFLLQFLDELLDISHGPAVDGVLVCLIDGCMYQDQSGTSLLGHTGDGSIHIPQLIIRLLINPPCACLMARPASS